jgi:hypothetical protein
MRAVFSVVALLCALLLVWLVSGRQLQSVAATGGGPGAADAAAQRVQEAITQGAAARASEAAAQ